MLQLAHYIPLAGHMGQDRNVGRILKGFILRLDTPRLYHLKKCTSDAVAEELISLYARYGVPKETYTYLGTNFTSQLL